MIYIKKHVEMKLINQCIEMIKSTNKLGLSCAKLSTA